METNPFTDGGAQGGERSGLARSRGGSPAAKGWAAFLMICVFGPPLGGVSLAVVVSPIVLIRETPAPDGVISLFAGLIVVFGLFSYLVAWPGVVLTGLYVGLRIGYNGRPSRSEMLLLVLAATFVNLGASSGSAFAAPGESLYVHWAKSFLFWAVPTFGAGIVLRWLMSWWGVLERQTAPKTK